MRWSRTNSTKVAQSARLPESRTKASRYPVVFSCAFLTVRNAHEKTTGYLLAFVRDSGNRADWATFVEFVRDQRIRFRQPAESQHKFRYSALIGSASCRERV